MKERYDIVIVGGGPAGSSAAIRIAAAGKRVALFEQKKFPRAKLCGEFVSPECLSQFGELGVTSRIYGSSPATIRKTLFYSRSGRSIEIDSEWFGPVGAIGISRSELDYQLLQQARESGVEVFENVSVTGPIVDQGAVRGVRIRDSDSERHVRARVTIDGTGRSRAVAKHLDNAKGLTRPEYVAFKTHLRDAAIESGACEIFSYAGGYGGCNAVEEGLFNLCFIARADDVKQLSSDPLRVMQDRVMRNKRAEYVLRDATVNGDWLAVPITRFGTRDPAPATGLICIGDAASFIDPFTGSGILMALESSRLAAQAVIQTESLEAISKIYRFSYASAFRNRLAVSGIIRKAAYVPAIADVAIAALSYSSFLRRWVATATRGRGYEKFDSLRTGN